MASGAFPRLCRGVIDILPFRDTATLLADYTLKYKLYLVYHNTPHNQWKGTYKFPSLLTQSIQLIRSSDRVIVGVATFLVGTTSDILANYLVLKTHSTHLLTFVSSSPGQSG